MVPRSGGTSIKPSISIILLTLFALNQLNPDAAIVKRKTRTRERTGYLNDQTNILKHDIADLADLLPKSYEPDEVKKSKMRREKRSRLFCAFVAKLKVED